MQPYPISIQQAATQLHRAHLHSLRSVWIQPAFQLWNCTVSGVARVKLSRMFTLIGTGLLAAKRWKSALSPVHYREGWFYHARLVILEGIMSWIPQASKMVGFSGTCTLAWKASQNLSREYNRLHSSLLFRTVGHPLLSSCFFQADYESCLKRKEMMASGQVLPQFALQPISQLNVSKNLSSTKWQMRH